MTALKKYSDFNLLAGSALRGDETLLIADTASSATVTATTISAVAATNTISSSSADLPIVKAGALVSISGFTDTAGELNGVHVVVSSTSSSLVIATDITVNEAAGQSVTVSEVKAMYQVSLNALTAFIAKTSGTNIPVNTQTGTSYTLLMSDYTTGSIVEMNNAAANSITIPPNSSVNFPVGAVIPFRQLGAGATSIIGGSGVTVLVSTGFLAKIGAQNASATIHQRAINVWVVDGHLAASV